MLDAERVRATLRSGTRFTEIRVLDQVDSTNRVVADLAAAGTPEGLVVAAEHQSAGRGRLGRTWEAPPSTALLVSVLLRPDLAPTRLHLATSAVALAARQACLTVGGFEPDLKWPNDLLLGDAKLAGILAEVSRGAVVVGIGLNVSAGPEGTATAEAAAGRPLDRAVLLGALLDDLDVRLGRWAEVARDYRRACATIGRAVVVTTPKGVLRGRAVSVDDDGRLVVHTADGAVAALAVGDVTHVRAA